MRAAILLGNSDAEHAELSGLFERVDREVLRLIPFHQVGFDLAVGEITDHLLDLLLFVAETEIHLGQLPRTLDWLRDVGGALPRATGAPFPPQA